VRRRETLHDAFGAPPPDLPWSRRLGAAAMELLWALAADAPAVVIEANFRPRSDYERGKLAALAPHPVEVYCRCDPHVAARRYDDRAETCHPIHVVTTLTAAARAEYDQPVGLGQLITVNTEHKVDLPEIAAAVRARLAAPVHAGLRSADDTGSVGIPGQAGGHMRTPPLLRTVDAVTVPVPDLDSGLRFYRDALGHQLHWRHHEIGQASLRLPESPTELVLATGLDYAPDWLVASADAAARGVESAGGQVITPPPDYPVGRVAKVADPFGNVLVVLDLSRGRYLTDGDRRVIGLTHGDG
jgi:predicted enzyme related to lactoylglutathione lyase